MECEDLLKNFSMVIEEERGCVIQQTRMFEEQNKIIQENIEKQINQINKISQDFDIIPSFDDLLNSTFNKAVHCHMLERNVRINKLEERINSLLAKIQNIEGIATKINEKLDQMENLVTEQSNEQSVTTDTPNYNLIYRRMAKDADSNILSNLEEKCKNADEKLGKLKLKYNKIKEEGRDIEERIIDTSKKCEEMEHYIIECMNVKTKNGIRGRVHNFSIETISAESVTISPAKRKSPVEIGSLIVLAPIKSLMRRQRFLDK